MNIENKIPDKASRLSAAFIDLLHAADIDTTYGMHFRYLEKSMTNYEAKKRVLCELLGDVLLTGDEIVAVVRALKKTVEEYYGETSDD